MRRFERNLWPCLALVLVACSAVIDFEPLPKQEDDTDEDGGSDEMDAGADGSDTGMSGDTGRPDSGKDDAQKPACELATHQGCDADELCCDRSDGKGPSCVEVLGSRECAACGMACELAGAPHCGDGRKCECEAGTGQACPNGESCVGEGADARCVQCETDDDCNGRSDGKKQCVRNKCVQCDRGDADSPRNDGCEGATPICNESNVCVACSTNPDNCPGDLLCNGALGCFGCNLVGRPGSNGCEGTTPICKTATNGQPQCVRCTSNAECDPLFCDSRPEGTGVCTNACAPASPPA